MLARPEFDVFEDLPLSFCLEWPLTSIVASRVIAEETQEVATSSSKLQLPPKLAKERTAIPRVRLTTYTCIGLCVPYILYLLRYIYIFWF